MKSDVKSDGDRDRFALVKQSEGRSDNSSLSVELTIEGLRDLETGCLSKVKAWMPSQVGLKGAHARLLLPVSRGLSVEAYMRGGEETKPRDVVVAVDAILADC